MSIIPGRVDPPGTRCPACRGPTRADVLDGLCGACLIGSAVLSPSRAVAGYQLEQELARGGAGIVYLARQTNTGKVVALKLGRDDVPDPGSIAEVFRGEAEAASLLDHPHIGRVLDSGVYEGRPFLVMPLMEGGSLEEAENRRRFCQPRAVLDLVSTVAGAIGFAHSRGILHCDLKPANILFGANGQARVCDFGLARPTDGTSVRVGGGTRGWMSPEQARHEPLTTASDVFALGALLYWLLNGGLPWGSGADFGDGVEQPALPTLGPWRPEIDWDLHAICQRALQMAPEHRYRGALEMVQDLERLQTHHPLQARPTPFAGRLWHAAQRHGAVQHVGAGQLSLMALTTEITAARQREELTNVVLDMNAYAASGQAAQVLYRLRDYAEHIERAAKDPAVQQIAESTAQKELGANPCAGEQGLASDEPLRQHAVDFDSMAVLNRWGCARARFAKEPPSPDYATQRYDWRDYFKGTEQAALRGEVSSMVRRAYRSSVSHHMKFAISAPILVANSWRGVVSGSITSASTLSRPGHALDSDERMTVLVGALEGEPSGSERPDALDFAYLVHPKLGFGDKLVLDHEHGHRLAQAFPTNAKPQFQLTTALPIRSADYVDPLLGGTWLAAFAPVGNTGHFVIVQTRKSAALRPARIILEIGHALTAAAGAAWIAVAIFASWNRRRRRSQA